MSQKVFYNGQIEDAKKFSYLLNNRAFRYGDGLFETIRVYNGRPLFKELHHKRLTAGLSVLKIKAPEADALYFFDTLQNIIAAQNIKSGGRIRYSVWRTSGGYYTPNSDCGVSLVEAQHLPQNAFELNEKGFLISIYKEITKPCTLLSPFKNPYAQLHVMAGMHKREPGWETVLINQQNNLCEGISSNIFILKDNILLTPAPDQACVKGIMRQVIIENLAAVLNLKTIETQISELDLQNADEVFFTNAIQGVRWALGFEKKRYYNTLSRKITGVLNEFAKDYNTSR
ncbi:MAG: D-alanine aminotransferase [Bacteroidetes bacterium ADurb.Bin408]|nr:MAG: D-alanine aminotransferase [Bacteroidetes bacterium ADurb.Bin408]